MSAQLLWTFCGELRRLKFPCKMTNKYCGDLRRQRIRATTAKKHTSTSWLVKFPNTLWPVRLQPRCHHSPPARGRFHCSCSPLQHPAVSRAFAKLSYDFKSHDHLAQDLRRLQLSSCGHAPCRPSARDESMRATLTSGLTQWSNTGRTSVMFSCSRWTITNHCNCHNLFSNHV